MSVVMLDWLLWVVVRKVFSVWLGNRIVAFSQQASRLKVVTMPSCCSARKLEAMISGSLAYGICLVQKI